MTAQRRSAGSRMESESTGARGTRDRTEVEPPACPSTRRHDAIRDPPEASRRLRGPLLQVRRQPLEALVQAVACTVSSIGQQRQRTRRRASGLDVPGALAERVQAELVGDLGGGLGVRQVLEGRQRSQRQFQASRRRGAAETGKLARTQ